MFKRLLSATLVLTIIGVSGTVSYSDELISRQKPKANIKVENESKAIKVFRPENDLTTSDKTILLSGTAKKDSKLIVEIYSVSNISDNKYNLSNLPKDDDYLPPVKEEIEVGPFGIFLKELELKLGVNKIYIYNEGNEEKSENIIEKYVYVNDASKAKKIIEDISNMGFSNTIKEIIKSSDFDSVEDDR